MKKLIFKVRICGSFCIILWLSLSMVRAQINTTSTGFATQINQVFAPLDKSRVPTGILQDYGLGLTDLTLFDGVAPDSVVGTGRFWDIYNTLYSSRIHSNATGFVSPAILDSRWYGYRTPGTIALCGVFFTYSSFRSDAVTSGRITISNNQVADRFVNNVWQNPYQQQNAFAVCPPVTGYNGLSFTVSLPASLWLTNNAATVQNLSIDVNDGTGYRTLTPGSSFNVSYADTGRKTWNYKLLLTNGTTLYSTSAIQITGQTTPTVNTTPATRTGVSNPEIISIMADEAYLNIKASGYMTIRYARDYDRVIRKPLIIAEGFDPGIIIAPELKFGQNDINAFLNNVAKSGSYNLLNIFNYDIIYVDYANGTDYIQRNALLLETVIRWVNANKSGTTPNVVLGQSMGSLVARYALKDMENKGQNHQTSLYVSHDGPHQGANVPVGLQYLARHGKGIYISVPLAAGATEAVQLIKGGTSPARVLSLADQPAARQMLINYIDVNGSLDNSVHTQWQQSLTSLGYPTQCRNVAIANGSECGTTEPYGPGGNLFSISGKATTSFLGDLVTMSTGFLFYSLAVTTSLPFLCFVPIPGSSELNINFWATAQADGTANQVYKGNITFKKTILWVIPVYVTVTDYNGYGAASSYPYDSYGGGGYPMPIVNNVNFYSSLASFGLTYSSQSYFSFIPTPSSLDIGAGNVTLAKTDYTTRYIGSAPPAIPKNTPFANFVAGYNSPGGNEGHISFLPRNGNWLAAELNGSPILANCTGSCGNVIITGIGDVVCAPANLALSGIAGSYAATWASKNGVATVNASTGAITHVSWGAEAALATVGQSGCDNKIITKNFWGGFPPVPSITSTGPTSLCPNSGGQFTASIPTYTGYVGNATYGWVYNGFTLASGSTSTSNPIILQTPSNFNGGSIQAFAFNQCGVSSAPGSIGINKAYNCPNGLAAYAAVPNPASGSVSITALTNNSQLSAAGTDSAAVNTATVNTTDNALPETVSVKIYDRILQLRKEYKNQKTRDKISLAGLESGLYYMDITDKSGTTKIQLVVE